MKLPTTLHCSPVLCGKLHPPSAHARCPPLPPPVASLEDLDLMGLQVPLAPILRHTSLTRLLIRGGNLRAAPGGGALGRLAELKCLDLRGTRLSPALVRRIGGLEGLTALNLGRVHAFGRYTPQLPRLPPQFSRLRSLRSLVLRQNPGIEGMAPLGCMTALTELDLGGCELPELPPAVGHLTSLRRLNLAGNDYLGAESLAHLEPLAGSLTELNLAWWDGAQLPPSLARLAALRDLNLTRRVTRPLEGGVQHVLGLTRLTRLMLAGWSDEACTQLSGTLREVWHRTSETPRPDTWASIRH